MLTEVTANKPTSKGAVQTDSLSRGPPPRSPQPTSPPQTCWGPRPGPPPPTCPGACPGWLLEGRGGRVDAGWSGASRTAQHRAG